jgi:MFS family permease
MPYASVLSAYAQERLAAGAAVVGMLSALIALGGVSAGVLVSRAVPHLGHLTVVRSALAIGLSAEAGLAFACSPLSAAPLLVLSGTAITSALIASSQWVQRESPDELRGRVSSFYFMAVMGPMPLGALLTGTLARALTVPQAYLINASLLGLLLIGVLVRRRAEGERAKTQSAAAVNRRVAPNS